MKTTGVTPLMTLFLLAVSSVGGLRFGGPGGTTVRRATARDLDAIQRCRSTPDPTGPSRVSPLFTGAWAIRNEGAIGLVALSQGDVVGTADCLEVPAGVNRPARAIVKNVFVVPAYRGRGIGQQLMAATMDVARDLGVEQLTLQVDTNNAPALRLYRSCGFTPSIPSALLRACAAIGLQLRIRFSLDVASSSSEAAPSSQRRRLRS